MSASDPRAYPILIISDMDRNVEADRPPAEHRPPRSIDLSLSVFAGSAQPRRTCKARISLRTLRLGVPGHHRRLKMPKRW